MTDEELKEYRQLISDGLHETALGVLRAQDSLNEGKFNGSIKQLTFLKQSIEHNIIAIESLCLIQDAKNI